MKTVILYYTFGGATKKEAERLADELQAQAYRVKEARGRGLLSAFFLGSPAAVHRKKVEVQPIPVDLMDYDKIIIGCPIWAGYPAPAFNTVAELLPTGKEVELFFCSGSGDRQKSEQETRELIEKKGCTVVSCRNVKTSVPPGKMKAGS